MVVKLADLHVGDVASVVNFEAANAYLRQRMLAYGLLPGAKFSVVREAPMGDPIQLELQDGLTLSLRRSEGSYVQVERLTCEKEI